MPHRFIISAPGARGILEIMAGWWAGSGDRGGVAETETQVSGGWGLVIYWFSRLSSLT